MRRQDREVKDFDKITATIEGCDCCRLGLNDDGQVYIVPMNFGFKVQNNNIVLYFHGASEGRKIDILKRNPHVGFEMDTGHHLNEADIAYQGVCIGTWAFTSS